MFQLLVLLFGITLKMFDISFSKSPSRNSLIIHMVYNEDKIIYFLCVYFNLHIYRYYIFMYLLYINIFIYYLFCMLYYIYIYVYIYLYILYIYIFILYISYKEVSTNNLSK